jgi:hypothetical protein
MSLQTIALVILLLACGAFVADVLSLTPTPLADAMVSRLFLLLGGTILSGLSLALIEDRKAEPKKVTV